jgi:hypothetical protein
MVQEWGGWMEEGKGRKRDQEGRQQRFKEPLRPSSLPVA